MLQRWVYLEGEELHNYRQELHFSNMIVFENQESVCFIFVLFLNIIKEKVYGCKANFSIYSAFRISHKSYFFFSNTSISVFSFLIP